MATDGVLTMRVPGWPLALFRIAYGLLYLDMALQKAPWIDHGWQTRIALGAFNVPGEWYWIWPLLTLPLFCFAASGAGRALGLDHWLEPALARRAARGSAWARRLRWAV